MRTRLRCQFPLNGKSVFFNCKIIGNFHSYSRLPLGICHAIDRRVGAAVTERKRDISRSLCQYHKLACRRCKWMARTKLMSNPKRQPHAIDGTGSRMHTASSVPQTHLFHFMHLNWRGDAMLHRSVMYNFSLRSLCARKKQPNEKWIKYVMCLREAWHQHFSCYNIFEPICNARATAPPFEPHGTREFLHIFKYPFYFFVFFFASSIFCTSFSRKRSPLQKNNSNNNMKRSILIGSCSSLSNNVLNINRLPMTHTH